MTSYPQRIIDSIKGGAWAFKDDVQKIDLPYDLTGKRHFTSAELQFCSDADLLRLRRSLLGQFLDPNTRTKVRKSYAMISCILENRRACKCVPAANRTGDEHEPM